MTGGETFEFAAAIAGVSIGLAAVLLLSALAISGTWRLFQRAGEASQAATRASLSVEELARRLGGESGPAPSGGGEQLARLAQQLERLLDEQRQLQETGRQLLDATVVGGPPSPALQDRESTISRLDGTVGQMAASLANLIQLLERQR